MSSRSRDRVTRSADAEVIAVWVGSERVLLRELGTAETFEAFAPHDVARYLHVGVRVKLSRDEEHIVGWQVLEQRGVREDLL